MGAWSEGLDPDDVHLSIALYNFNEEPAKNRVIEDRVTNIIISSAPAILSLTHVHPLLDICKCRDPAQADLYTRLQLVCDEILEKHEVPVPELFEKVCSVFACALFAPPKAILGRRSSFASEIADPLRSLLPISLSFRRTQQCFPGRQYKTETALSFLARLPLLFVKTPRPKPPSGKAVGGFWYVAYSRPSDPKVFTGLVRKLHETAAVAANGQPAVSPETFRLLTSVCNTVAEKERMMYVVTKKLSAREARDLYGVRGLNSRRAQMEARLESIQRIAELYQELTADENNEIVKAWRAQRGLTAEEDDEDDEGILSDSDDNDEDYATNDDNFFDDQVEEGEGNGEAGAGTHYDAEDAEAMFSNMAQSFHDSRDMETLLGMAVADDDEQSGEARDRDNLTLALGARNEDELMLAVNKQCTVNARRLRRRQKTAEANVFADLCQVRGVYRSKLRRRFPDIGQVVERFCRKSQIGADTHRRTGHLVLVQGPGEKGKHLTFPILHEALKEHYKEAIAESNQSISLSSVKRLCCARNARRRSSTWYLGWANMVSRAANKGFNLKQNVDDHWNNAMYRGLDMLQGKDGTKHITANRDDQAGRRCGTMGTNSKQPSLQVKLEP